MKFGYRKFFLLGLSLLACGTPSAYADDGQTGSSSRLKMSDKIDEVPYGTSAGGVIIGLWGNAGRLMTFAHADGSLTRDVSAYRVPNDFELAGMITRARDAEASNTLKGGKILVKVVNDSPLANKTATFKWRPVEFIGRSDSAVLADLKSIVTEAVASRYFSFSNIGFLSGTGKVAARAFLGSGIAVGSAGVVLDAGHLIHDAISYHNLSQGQCGPNEACDGADKLVAAPATGESRKESKAADQGL